eukprot:1147526-Pelagomonas_calceolata.AAC.1
MFARAANTFHGTYKCYKYSGGRFVDMEFMCKLSLQLRIDSISDSFPSKFKCNSAVLGRYRPTWSKQLQLLGSDHE